MLRRVPTSIGDHRQAVSLARCQVIVIDRKERAATSPATWVGMPRCAEINEVTLEDAIGGRMQSGCRARHRGCDAHRR
ncbi:hypothetical protein GCM10010454_14230 [Microbacterium arabinogalactanolyticum]